MKEWYKELKSTTRATYFKTLKKQKKNDSIEDKNYTEYLEQRIIWPRSENWLGFFKSVKEIDLQQGLFSDAPVGQKLYLHKSELDSNIHVLQHHKLDWPFPDKYLLDIGYSVRSFKFVFENLNDTPKTLIIPSKDLINTESGQEETTSVQTLNDFNPNYKGIDDNIKKYKYNNYLLYKWKLLFIW